MKTTTILEIINEAKRCVKDGKHWHFHILTQGCQLNEHPGFSLIIEIPSENRQRVFYSDNRPMAAGKELIQLLHGNDVVQGNGEPAHDGSLSPNAEIIIARARQLSENGKFWHHHVLFPDCVFNKDKGRWTILFEDQEKGGTLKSVSDDEPKAELKQIETLFYQQDKK